MLDLSWGELMVIGTVALIVIGPKDLPAAIRAVSRFIGQARKLARDFQSGMEQMAREAGVDDLKREVSRMASGEYGQQMKSYVDPDGVLDRPDLAIPEFDPPPDFSDKRPPTMSPPSAPAATGHTGTAAGQPPPLPPPETAEPGLPFDALDKVEPIDRDPAVERASTPEPGAAPAAKSA
jgi:sec-independent protein translocase protein TatB